MADSHIVIRVAVPPGYFKSIRCNHRRRSPFLCVCHSTGILDVHGCSSPKASTAERSVCFTCLRSHYDRITWAIYSHVSSLSIRCHLHGIKLLYEERAAMSALFGKVRPQYLRPRPAGVRSFKSRLFVEKFRPGTTCHVGQ
jgi:predicted Fe-S protein YdhL (DUF1289 family)